MKKAVIDWLIIALLVGILSVSGYYCYDITSQARFNALKINISHGDSLRLISEQDIRECLGKEPFGNMFNSLDNIDTYKIEQHLKSNSYIKKIAVYKNLQGDVTVDILQREPIMRIIPSNGQSNYYDAEKTILPTSKNFTCDVPIITCSDLFASQINNKQEGEVLLNNLILLTEYISEDQFWNSQIVQININSDNEIELIPRIGNHIIVLCNTNDMENIDNYLTKLKIFYDKVLTNKGWNSYNKIILKYTNQIVCK